MQQQNLHLGGFINQKIKDYQLLVKFRLNLFVVGSSIFAFLLAKQNAATWQQILTLALGGFLVTGGANALNEVLEKDFDKLMERTANRPLPANRMSISEAVLAAGLMSVVGILLLGMFNPLTAMLGALSLLLYAFVYTPMKRFSPIAVWIGAIPGALPTLIGCVANDGYITWLGISLFAIQFIWQFPHFWSIAWLGHEDYTRAGYHLLPSKTQTPNSEVGMYSFTYALALLPLSWSLFYFGVTGMVSAIGVSLMGVAYSYYAWNLYKKADKTAAKKLMFCSFFYLPLVLVLFLIDKL